MFHFLIYVSYFSYAKSKFLCSNTITRTALPAITISWLCSTISWSWLFTNDSWKSYAISIYASNTWSCRRAYRRFGLISKYYFIKMG